MTGLLASDLFKSFGSHPVLRGLDMEARSGTFTAILGESGSGKTTLLRLLAGFERPDRGTITIGERVVDSTSQHTRPELRHIGYVPQEGSLFPHLTVESNIGFGLPRKLRKARANELLELVGLAGLGRRYPHELSGGQQQRVALARAMAIDPEIVLLDEPFASLDTHLRVSVRDEVSAILRRAGTTAILVTHDQEEAFSLADMIAVLRGGKIAQFATPQDIYTTPVDADVARFVGDANLLVGQMRGDCVETPLGTLAAICHGERPGDSVAVTVLLRPEQIRVEVAEQIQVDPPSGANGLSGQITHVRYQGPDKMLRIANGGERQLVARAPSSSLLVPGTRVRFAIDGPVLVWPAGGSKLSEPEMVDAASAQSDA